MSEQNNNKLIRSSTAEYLTFIAAGGGSETSVEMRYEDENIWLTQKTMAVLYDVSIPAINQHLKRIFADRELEETSVVKEYLTRKPELKKGRSVPESWSSMSSSYEPSLQKGTERCRNL